MKNLTKIVSNFPKNGIVTCSSCNNEMPIGEDVVIFGDKWFHNSCNLEKKNE